MRFRNTWLFIIVIGAVLAANSEVEGQKKKGPGGGDDTSGHEPVTFTFRDCQDGWPSPAFADLHPGTAASEHCVSVATDRILSDTGQSYVGGLDDVEAYVGTKGTAGNFWLKVPQSARSLVLDFSECTGMPAECRPPFDLGALDRASIYVQISAVRRRGAFGMAIGESLLVPMRIYFEIVPGEMNFVHFDSTLGGRNPCKGRSEDVQVDRTDVGTWVVYGDAVGCMSEENGFGGTYRLPFRFVVDKP